MTLNISELEKKLKIKIKNKKLIMKAFVHKSLNQKINNEKLEFLGDRVIGLILSKKLFDLYPDDPEGILDKKFAKLVNRDTCASIAWSIGLKDFISMGNQKKMVSLKDKKILSDTCEAMIGAIYIDRGFNYAKEFVLRIWQYEINKSITTVLDSKTKLQEYSLKINKKLPNYKLLSFKGPRHNPIFKISVSIVGTKSFIGYGHSKKEAEQEAAQKLLKSVNII